MCKSHNPRRIDACMKKIIKHLAIVLGGNSDILACCCGHGRYPRTIIIKQWDLAGNRELTTINRELCSGIIIPRKKRFYKKDKDGYYYIPEVVG